MNKPLLSPLCVFLSLTFGLLTCSITVTVHLIATAQESTSGSYGSAGVTLGPSWLGVSVPEASMATTAATNVTPLAARAPLAVTMSGGGHRLRHGITAA